jgi:hypothetical protein
MMATIVTEKMHQHCDTYVLLIDQCKNKITAEHVTMALKKAIDSIFVHIIC